MPPFGHTATTKRWRPNFRESVVAFHDASYFSLKTRILAQIITFVAPDRQSSIEPSERPIETSNEHLGHFQKQHLQKCLHHRPKTSHLALLGHLERVQTLSSSWASWFSALLPFSPLMRKDKASSKRRVRNLSNARQVLGCARERRARRLICRQDGQLNSSRKGKGDGKKITMYHQYHLHCIEYETF